MHHRSLRRLGLTGLGGPRSRGRPGGSIACNAGSPASGQPAPGQPAPAQPAPAQPAAASHPPRPRRRRHPAAWPAAPPPPNPSWADRLTPSPTSRRPWVAAATRPEQQLNDHDKSDAFQAAKAPPSSTAFEPSQDKGEVPASTSPATRSTPSGPCSRSRRS